MTFKFHRSPRKHTSEIEKKRKDEFAYCLKDSYESIRKNRCLVNSSYWGTLCSQLRMLLNKKDWLNLAIE